jgi:hypothetical protein
MKETELLDLFRRMRAYRWAFWIAVASAVLYGAAAAALSARAPARVPWLGDAALAYGAFAAAAVLLGRWIAFRPRTLRARGVRDLGSMIQHTFLTLLFLLGSAESLGLAAVTAAAFGAHPPWKPVLLCFWQILVSVALTPERSHWDRLLTRWEETLDEGVSHETT